MHKIEEELENLLLSLKDFFEKENQSLQKGELEEIEIEQKNILSRKCESLAKDLSQDETLLKEAKKVVKIKQLAADIETLYKENLQRLEIMQSVSEDIIKKMTFRKKLQTYNEEAEEKSLDYDKKIIDYSV